MLQSCLSLWLARVCYGLTVGGFKAYPCFSLRGKNHPDPKSGQDLDQDVCDFSKYIWSEIIVIQIFYLKNNCVHLFYTVVVRLFYVSMTIL